MNRSRLGPFALEESLGTRDSDVYHALHVRKQKTVALRVISAPLLESDPHTVESYQHEFSELRRLKHPNIVRCFGGGFDRSVVFIANERMYGESLAEVLQRREKLPWEWVLDYALQLSAALQHAHDAGIIHGGIRPNKILISDQEQVKLCGFRIRDQRPEHDVRRAAFCAPEQLEQPTAPHAKWDIYGLGCVMYLMLCGKPPFRAMSVAALARQKRFPPPSAAISELSCPVWLDSLIGQMLLPNPLERPHTAAAVHLALLETRKVVAERRSVVEHASAGFSPLPTKMERSEARRLMGFRRRRRPDRSPVFDSGWLLLLLLLLLLGAAATWLVWPPNERRMFERAEQLMASDSPVDWRRAQDQYLEPLLERFPDGTFAPQARKLLDQIEMQRTERRFLRRLQFGRRPQTEAERMYAEAWKYESFGDGVTAIEKYQSLVHLLQEDAAARPFVHLAQRQIKRLNDTAYTSDRARFVETRITTAQEFYEQGQIGQAKEIWSSIVVLYEGNKSLQPLVDRVKASLENLSDTSTDASRD